MTLKHKTFDERSNLYNSTLSVHTCVRLLLYGKEHSFFIIMIVRYSNPFIDLNYMYVIFFYIIFFS